MEKGVGVPELDPITLYALSEGAPSDDFVQGTVKAVSGPDGIGSTHRPGLSMACPQSTLHLMSLPGWPD